MDSRSGGKIVTRRYRRHNIAPYDRGPASSQPAPKSSNLLAGIIFPATRIIASGAAKIFSSVFDSDDSSSSSLSSSDSRQVSDSDVDNDNHDNHDLIYSVNEDHGTTPEGISGDPQLNGYKDYKENVEQLLRQGKFSKQEGDRFIEIIKSQITESNINGEKDGGGPFETADGNWSNDIDYLWKKAVTEARKWLEEKKVGSGTMLNAADESPGLNSFKFGGIGDEVGSPADIAKLYVKSRSQWGSPSAEHAKPATVTSPLFKDDFLSSSAGESPSLFKKRPSLASGSWNIQEEIRRVRTKATEEMLNPSPSTRIVPSSYASSPRHGQDSLGTNLFDLREDERKKLYSSAETKSHPHSADMDPAGDRDSDTLASKVIRRETVLAILATSALGQNRDSQAAKTPNEHHTSSSPPIIAEKSKDNCDPSSSISKDTMVGANRQSEGIENVDGSVEVGAGDIQGQQRVERNSNGVGGDEKMTIQVLSEDVSEFLSEASVEVPVVDEADATIAKVSQTSSLVQAPQNPSKLGAKVDEMPSKPGGKKPGRGGRRIRGRGRG